VLGSLLAVFDHLLTRDSVLAPRIHQKLFSYWPIKGFDGIAAYRVEILVICLGLAILLSPAFTWLVRFARAWWFGITSVLTPVVACITYAGLNFAAGHPWTAVTLAFALVALASLAEFWRRSFQTSYSIAPIKIPNKSPHAEPKWDVFLRGDPIRDWEDDLVGRTAVVELLADQALRLPVVALHGGRGDGKSSVLNLLGSALKEQVIVVPFSAWLPGSEATLVGDLFRDIAAGCRKYVVLPQMRKASLAFARTVSSSVAYLAGIKELIPAQSQRDEVEELRNSFSRLPKPIVVLLDEIDRMQKDELLVLLKILRGADSIQNVSFVCAFSEPEIKEIGTLSSEDLEKFFPVSVNLSPPKPEFVGALLSSQLKQGMSQQKWFSVEGELTEFSTLFEQLWSDGLKDFCTNLRKAGLLLNDVMAAGRPIAGDVNALDLVGIEAIRRFCLPVYALVKANARYLTNETGAAYFAWEKPDPESFFKELDSEIASCAQPRSARALLCWLFPKYDESRGHGTTWRSSRRPPGEDALERGKRICVANYFQTYFRSAVPAQMFSNTELSRAIAIFNGAGTPAAVTAEFSKLLASVPSGSDKREDFLWRLSRRVTELSEPAAESLAGAVALHASEYTNDDMNLGEARHGQNIIFGVAQKFSGSPAAQHILEQAIACATDDAFALRLVQGVEHREHNKILLDFSHIDADKVRAAFFARMRARYSTVSDPPLSSNAHAGWQVFRRWVDTSTEDRQVEQDFWRRYIGSSRKRLAQAIDFVYPGRVVWQGGSPRPDVNALFPVNEFEQLIQSLPNDEALDEREELAISRMSNLIAGLYQSWPGGGFRPEDPPAVDLTGEPPS